MGSLRFILIVLIVFVLAECRNDRRPELFELNYVIDFTVPAGLNTIETHFFLVPAVASFFDDRLVAQDLILEDITSVNPKFAVLSTVFSDVDLDFVRRLEIRIADPFNPDFSREIFYLDPVPPNTRTVIRPFPGLEDVKDFVAANTFGIQIRLTFRRVTNRSFDMRLAFDLSAKAKE